MAAISTIRNLGPATEEAFAKAGLTTAEELYALGAHESYRRWLQAGLAPHFIGYYVLVMALQGRPWNDCKGEEKKTLRRAFDQLKSEVEAAETQSPPLPGRLPRPLDQALRQIGVLPA
jgi:hypothetical protein